VHEDKRGRVVGLPRHGVPGRDPIWRSAGRLAGLVGVPTVVLAGDGLPHRGDLICDAAAAPPPVDLAGLCEARHSAAAVAADAVVGPS